MNLLESRYGRFLAFFLMYVTEGLPLGFAAGAVSVWLRREGIGAEELGWFLGSLYAPWGFKWVAGPFVDLLGVRRFGRRRGWILLTQTLLVAMMFVAGTIDYVADFGTFAAIMVTISAIGAVQDVAIDALAVKAFAEEDRGLGNGLMFAGATIGQVLGGSGMLWLASATGSRQLSFYGVAGMFAMVLAVVTFLVREKDDGGAIGGDLRNALAGYVVTAGKAMLASRAAILATFYALLPPTAMALGLSLASTMQVEIGMTDDEIGWMGTLGGAIGALGSVMGGWVSDRVGSSRAMAVYVALTLLPTAALAYAAMQAGLIFPSADGTPAAVAPALVTAFWVTGLVYAFTSALSNGTRMAVFMSVCDPKVAATQFTAYMAMSNLAISYSAAWQGTAVERWGFPVTLGLDCLVPLVGLALLPFIRRPAARVEAVAA